MRILALDVGSRTIKRVILEDGALVDWLVVDATYEPVGVCRRLLQGREPDVLVATGYGRHLVAEKFGAVPVTEIAAVAAGARWLDPGCQVVLDVGGQDIKAVWLREDGGVRSFEMNDRCASGTGRFLEVMATALGMTLAEFVEAAARAPEARPVSSMCTVFAESEVVSALASGVSRESLARGLHEAMASRIRALLGRSPASGRLLFCGGGARNRVLADLLVASLAVPVRVAERPQVAAALGAALWAKKNSPKNPS